MSQLTRRICRLEDQFGIEDGSSKGIQIVASRVGLALDAETCVEILRECGFLPIGPGFGLVNLCNIPDGLKCGGNREISERKGYGALWSQRFEESWWTNGQGWRVGQRGTGMTRMQCRLKRLEGILSDAMGLIPHSANWLKYWDRQYYLFLSGQDENATRLSSVVEYRAVMKFGEECADSRVGRYLADCESEKAAERVA
jgi:hypothetical protein